MLQIYDTFLKDVVHQEKIENLDEGVHRIDCIGVYYSESIISLPLTIFHNNLLSYGILPAMVKFNNGITYDEDKENTSDNVDGEINSDSIDGGITYDEDIDNGVTRGENEDSKNISDRVDNLIPDKRKSLMNPRVPDCREYEYRIKGRKCDRDEQDRIISILYKIYYSRLYMTKQEDKIIVCSLLENYKVPKDVCGIIIKYLKPRDDHSLMRFYCIRDLSVNEMEHLKSIMKEEENTITPWDLGDEDEDEEYYW